MLSVGSRDGERKRSMLGLEGRGGAEGRLMEENELEEGEAYSGQEEDIDPDALSYIDEKLQHVLGHFQKEFEGGVSAETLGAKFGGYGSFLPAYQRSPPVTLSQTKSLVKVQNNNLSKSPHNLQPAMGCQNASVLANASITKASSASVVQPTEKSGKGDACIRSCSTVGIPRHELTRQTLDIRDPKSLKVRIKVGPDNVLIRNKPEIYSDLGLDVSPSPSLEDSPGGSREISPKSPDTFSESPSIILQVMTRFLAPGSCLLSPLSENLLHLFDKDDSLIASVKKSTPQIVMPENCTPSNDFIYKDNKSTEKCQKLKQDHEIRCEDVTTSLRNEIERRTPEVKNVISCTQDMALPSSAWCGDKKEEVHFGGNSIKENSKISVIHSETNNIPMVGRVQALDLRKDNHFEIIDSGRMDGVDNLDKDIVPSKGKPYSKPFIIGKEFEETNGSLGISRKSKSKSQKKIDKKKYDADRHRIRKDSAEFEELVEEQPVHKACSNEKKLMEDKDHVFEDGITIKGSQNEAQFNELNMNKHSALFSVTPKGKMKMLHVKGADLETKSKISKLKKEINKDHNTETQSELSAQVQQVESRTHILNSSIPTERSNEKVEVNKDDNFHISGPVTDALAPSIDTVLGSEPVPTIPVVLIEDNWVCCDICQRWRLLPYGTKPESLPKKWHCSMQIWLPGLNNCNVRENETTKAFHELYQFPPPGGDVNKTAHLSAAASSVTSFDHMNPARRQEHVMHNAPQNGKKKHGATDATNLPIDPSLTNLPNSLKNLYPSSGNKDINDVRCIETDCLSKPKPERTSRSMNFSAEKHMDKQNKKRTTSSSFKVGGNISGRSDKYSKPMNNGGTDVDSHWSSKKLKKDGSYHLVNDLHSSIDAAGKMDANGVGELLAKASKNNLQNYSDRSSKDLKSKSGSSKKSRAEINLSNGQYRELSGASEVEKSCRYDSNDKKRKLKERQEKQACQETSMSSERVTVSRTISKEALVDGELRRSKKAKVVKSEGKVSCAFIGGENIEMKGCSARITLSSNRKQLPDEINNDDLQAATDAQLLHYQGSTISGQALDCINGLKRDVTYMRSLAATSSSSKVSGSQKGKANLLETKGSPVESVSSSPMKIVSTENNSARRDALIKDNILSMGYSGMGSPKRFSDVEFDGSSDQSGTRTKGPSNDRLRSSEIYRSADSGVLDSLKVSHDYEDTETRRSTGVKAIDGRHSKIIKRDGACSTDIGKANIVCVSGNVPQHSKKYHLERTDKYNTCNEDEHGGSGEKNNVKSSSHSREKHRSLNSDKSNLRVSGIVTEHKDLQCYRTCNSRNADAEFVKSRKKINLENHSKQHKAHELRVTVAGENQRKPISQQNLQPTASYEKNPSVLLTAEAIDGSAMDLGKGMQFPNQAKDKIEKKILGPQKAPESIKGGNLERCPVDALNIEASKSTNPPRKLDEQNGILPNPLRQPATSTPGLSSPMKKDGHPNVNIFIKEARDLKHTANRLKSVGLEDESSGIFFESALKFLHAAFLLEPPNSESTKQGELVPSTHALVMYYETAKFCEFCAHEYERLKEMVAAALAYKCAEVAYLKVAYYKHPSASKDRLELQIALDAPMPGESPSSSASDVDNLNNQGGIDKVASTRALSSPQIAGNHPIAARNRPHVMRLLTYTNYLNCAFEATKKSQNAITAASTDQGKSGINICSARKVLDFNFHNVEGLLRLVRVSMNSTGH